MKERIKQFAIEAGADDVGIAAVADYQSPRSPDPESIFPGVKSMVVLAYREVDNCDTDNPQLMMNGRLDLMEFTRSVNYKVGRFLKKEFGARAMTAPASYPLEMSRETSGCIGDISMRHAAHAAGLGSFGRHNLIIHPELGTRVIFTAILTDLELDSDDKVTEDLCIHCDKCVKACPGDALAEEGKTNLMGCLKNSQPYGIGPTIKHWSKYAGATPEERMELVADPHFWRLYQAGFIGFQYFCFNCLKECPVGQ